MAACARAHHDVAGVVVDDDAHTDFGALRFCHHGSSCSPISKRIEKRKYLEELVRYEDHVHKAGYESFTSLPRLHALAPALHPS
jgi:hypothetical protein